MGFPGGSGGKEPACDVGDLGSIPGLGRSPGGGHGNPLQYSCLGNPHGQRNLGGCSPWDRTVRHNWTIKHAWDYRTSKVFLFFKKKKKEPWKLQEGEKTAHIQRNRNHNSDIKFWRKVISNLEFISFPKVSNLENIIII